MEHVNRHGNTHHPDLPACACCGEWRWIGGDATFARGIEVSYSCATTECEGRAFVVSRGGVCFAVLFAAPTVDGCFEVPARAAGWLTDARRAMWRANADDCIYAGAACPTNLPLREVPVGAGSFLVGLVEWRRVRPGEPMDVAPLFAERVRRSIAARASAA